MTVADKPEVDAAKLDEELLRWLIHLAPDHPHCPDCPLIEAIEASAKRRGE